MSKGVLLDERIVAVQPSMVRAFGLYCAVVIQQIHFHRGNTGTEELQGHQWVVMPYETLSEETGLSVRALRGAVEKLETEGVLLSVQPTQWNRTKWYRIEYTHDRFAQLGPTDESGTSNRRKRRLSSDENGASPLLENQEWARKRETDESQVATAAQRKRESGNAITAMIDAEGASPRTLDHIATIRKARHEGKAS